MLSDMLAVLWLPGKYRNAQQQLGKFIYKITGDNVDWKCATICTDLLKQEKLTTVVSI